MALIVFFRKIFANLIRLPVFLVYQVHDRFMYYKEKRYKDFDRWGIHIFTSKFGAGKTSSMVYTRTSCASVSHRCKFCLISSYPVFRIIQ